MLKTLFGVALLALLSMPAQSNNGMSEYTFSFPWERYVECLGETVTGTAYVAARAHRFETPSGIAHWVDNYTIYSELVGVSTGRQWVGKGPSPAVNHVVKNGESFFYADNFMLVPVPVYGIADGPRWRWNITLQLRWDEEGNLTNEHFNFVAGDMRCLGSK